MSDLPPDPDLVPLDLSASALVTPGAVGAGRARAIRTLAVIGLGGALGAVARYGLAVALPSSSRGFPWSTFLVNVTGSAVLGFLLVTVTERLDPGHWARPLLGTGFVGAYTTFSTFAVENVMLVRHGDPGEAAVYILASLAAGLAAGFLGIVGARMVVSPRGPETGGRP